MVIGGLIWWYISFLFEISYICVSLYQKKYIVLVTALLYLVTHLVSLILLDITIISIIIATVARAIITAGFLLACWIKSYERT